MTAPAAMELSRSTLFAAVCKERAKSWFAKRTSDQNVRKLARAYPATVFLLDWYSRYMQANKPLPYTSTWNLQIKVALNTLRSFDKGLRLHNGFIHWRHGRAEIAYGTLYFLLALLDRWIELFCGGRLIGLIVLDNNKSRVAVGLGLVYYLFGAVALDIKVHPLYDAVQKVSLERLQSAAHLKDVAQQDARNKQKLYWGTLIKFLFIHAWGLAFTTAFFWAYVEGSEATILLLSYLVAYTGLLWFQYNKVFTGPGALRPLVIAVVLGFAVGVPLRLLRPGVFWNDVFALGIADWTAGILTFLEIKLYATPFKDEDTSSQKAIGPHNDVSTQQLDTLFDDLDRLPARERFVIKSPSQIGNEVLQILTAAKHAPKALELKVAFPGAFALLDQIIVSWDTQETVVEGVSPRYMIGRHHDVYAVSRKVDKQLKIFVGVDSQGGWTNNLEINCHAYLPLLCRLHRIAEAIVHEFCEVGLGLTHSDAVLAELLVSSREELELPHRIRHQLETSSSRELYDIINRRDEELVRHLCLDTNCDLEWDSLPNDVRATFVKRVISEPYELNDVHLRWIESKSGQKIPCHTYLARRDLHGCVCLMIEEYAASLLRDPVQRTVPVRREVVNDMVLDAERAMDPSTVRTGFFSTLLRPLDSISRVVRTVVKFMFLAFIAEPEFQRELAYCLTGSLLRIPLTFIATRVWIYSRMIQNLLVPFFFVCSLLNNSNLVLQAHTRARSGAVYEKWHCLCYEKQQDRYLQAEETYYVLP